MKSLIRNALRTPDGTLLESVSQHDYKTCLDANGKEYMVDGGLAYLRRSANGDEEDLSLYDDEPHEVQRNVITWGTYGINGDQPLTHITVAEMDTDHLVAVLQTCTPMTHIANCMRLELEQR